MATRTIWACDGCDSEIQMTGLETDWKVITITTSGFKGYPVGDYANGERRFDLCPSCQRALVKKANPIRWSRSVPEVTT